MMIGLRAAARICAASSTRAGAGSVAAGLHRARGIGVLDGLVPLGQHLARQREVDRALRLGLGQGQRAVHHRLELVEALLSS